MTPTPTFPSRPLARAAAALALSAAAALAATPALAMPLLQATLAAPAELHLGAHDAWRMTLRNVGSTAAGSTTLRMALPVGINAVTPLPGGCAVVTEALGAKASVRQMRCTLSMVPARATRSFAFVLKAPTVPMIVPHQIHASASNVVGVALSNTVHTDYRAYSVPVTPGTVWEMASCNNGNAGPLAWNLCPASAEIVSEVTLAVGGVIDNADGFPGTWLQTDPLSLRLDWAADSGIDAVVQNYSVINSRCLRGPGESVPPPGGTKTYFASRICRR